MRSYVSLLALYFASVAYAAIGPRANLFIENKVIGPDGFNRSYVSVTCNKFTHLMLSRAELYLRVLRGAQLHFLGLLSPEKR